MDYKHQTLVLFKIKQVVNIKFLKKVHLNQDQLYLNYYFFLNLC